MNPTPTPREIAEMRDLQRRARAVNDAREKMASWPESKRRQMQLQGSSIWLTAAEKSTPSPRAGDSIEGESQHG